MPYDPQTIEPKWQQFWLEKKTFGVKVDPSRPKYYVLDMFPYPSGSGLHVGHPKGYTATDVVSRWMRMKGFNVLHPMGWDAFGLPAERSAVRENLHPAVITKRNVANFKRQLQRLGFAYDWDRELSTTDADYYKWTQWIFLQLYEKGLAYQAEVAVNWCPALGTVLANEEVQDGKYVETGDPVERRSMRQWMMKITAYAERLITDLEGLDWPESLKEMQRNWIGRSEGAEVTFKVEYGGQWLEQSQLSGRTTDEFTIFTTRPDTMYGATYCVLAPEHALVAKITTPDRKREVDAYVAAAKGKAERDRMVEGKEKTGVFTGAFAINPATKKPIPIWVADYVLAGYGSGAIMAVPGHDERDWEFARAFDLPIVEVVKSHRRYAIQQAHAPSVVVLDANAYRNLTSGKTPEEADVIGRSLRVRDMANGLQPKAHPTTLLEMLARLADQSHHDWKWCYAAVRCLWSHCSTPSSTRIGLDVVDSTQLQLARFLASFISVDVTQRYRSTGFETARLVKCISNVISVPASAWTSSANSELVDISKYVCKSEDSFASEFEGLLNDVGRQRAKRAEDPELVRAISRGLLAGASFELASPIDEETLSESSDDLIARSPLASAFGKLVWRKVMVDRANIRNPRHKNWCWDYQLSFAVSMDSQVLFVSDDEDFYRAAEETSGSIPVLKLSDYQPVVAAPLVADGVATNSELLDGLPTAQAKAKMTSLLEMLGVGKKKVQYKLRDWLFSRQRYWGEPFPIVHLADGTTAPVPYEDLPLVLPPIDEYKPTADGQPPLARAKEWLKTTDKKSGKPASRETNTMPQWAGSCWYYLRFCDPRNKTAAWSKEAENYWMPVDLYVGGVEHAVLHLLYARFWHKVLFDLGLVSTKEPFQKLRNQGLITAHSYQDAAGKYYYPEQVEQRAGAWVVKETGTPLVTQLEKMAKSKFNVVNPDDVVRDYGADSMRLYECFIGPLEHGGAWQTSGVEGVYRFLERTWRLYFLTEKGAKTDVRNPALTDGASDPELERALHKTIKKVTDDLGAMGFNTAISAMMVFVNAATGREKLPVALLEKFILLLAPFAPHMAEEVWAALGHKDTIANAPWPAFDPALVKDDTLEIAVQVNGKLRDTISIPADADAAAVQKLALASEKVQKALEGKTPKKVIVVPRKIVNVVV